jgi:hypothetical protein
MLSVGNHNALVFRIYSSKSIPVRRILALFIGSPRSADVSKSARANRRSGYASGFESGSVELARS